MATVPRISAGALLFLSGCLGGGHVPADGEWLVVPRARRTLAAHVRAILDRIPAGPYGDRALELDDLVCAEREIEWGAEGGYWDVVLSLAKSASLDVEDSWTQFAKLVPVPGKLRAARVHGSYLLGFRRDEGPPARFTPVIVIPPWWDLGGHRPPFVSMEHAAKPPAALRNWPEPFEIPADVLRVKVTWEIERYRRVSTQDLSCNEGSRYQVPGADGMVEILDVRAGHWKEGGEGDKSLTTIRWRTSDVQAERAELILEDGSKADFLQGSGRGNDERPGWTRQYTYKADRTKAKAFRVLLVHEAVTEHPVLSMDRREWEAPATPDLLAGSVVWTRRPVHETIVIVGAVRTDGWGKRTARIPVRPSEEHPGLEGIQDETGWSRPFLLFIPSRGDLRYRVFGLDAGEWIVWVNAGDWLEVRRISVPGSARVSNIVVAPDRAADVRVRGSSDRGATLRLLDGRWTWTGEGDDPLQIDLERGEKDEWKAGGLKPGDYLLNSAGKERKVRLVEGMNDIDLR